MNRQLEKGSRPCSGAQRGGGGTRTDPLPPPPPQGWHPPGEGGLWGGGLHPQGTSTARPGSPRLPELLEQAGPVLVAAAAEPTLHLAHRAAALPRQHLHVSLGGGGDGGDLSAAVPPSPPFLSSPPPPPSGVPPHLFGLSGRGRVEPLQHCVRGGSQPDALLHAQQPGQRGGHVPTEGPPTPSPGADGPQRAPQPSAPSQGGRRGADPHGPGLAVSPVSPHGGSSSIPPPVPNKARFVPILGLSPIVCPTNRCSDAGDAQSRSCAGSHRTPPAGAAGGDPPGVGPPI